MHVEITDWIAARDGAGLPARVLACAYLGSHVEVNFETALGAVFVVSSDVDQDWQAGDDAVLRLSGRGVSVVVA